MNHRLSDDPEIVERRLWYVERGKEASEKLAQSSHIPPWIQHSDNDDKISSDSKNNGESTSIRYYYVDENDVQEKQNEDDPMLTLPLLDQAEEKEKEKPKMKMFTTSTLEVVDDNAKKQESLYQPLERRTLIIEDYWGPLPDLQPRKWMYPLNNSAKEAFLDFRTFGKLVKGKGKRKVLFCFHGLGSNHMYFTPWIKVLHEVEGMKREVKLGDHDSDIELWSICLPGRSGRFFEINAQSVHILAGDVILLSICSKCTEERNSHKEFYTLIA
jgi:hypothetical protein